MTQETRLRVASNPTRGWQANKKTHLCVASGIRAMPETEKPPAMRVDIYFQFYNLVPNLTSKENVELASEIVKDALDPLRVLKDVGLAKRINNFRRSFRVGNSSVLPLRGDRKESENFVV